MCASSAENIFPDYIRIKEGHLEDKDIINKTFNELTILRHIGRPDTEKYRTWNTGQWVECRCSCGEITELPLYGVVNEYIKSCGCLRKEKAALTLEEIKKNNPTPTAIYLTFKDKTLNISDWSKETGIPRSTIMYRISKDLSVDKILERRNENE